MKILILKYKKYLIKSYSLHITSFVCSLVIIFGGNVLYDLYDKAGQMLAALWKDIEIIGVMYDDVSVERTNEIVGLIRQHEYVLDVRIISPDEGLEMLKKEETLSTSLEALSNNPLPQLIVISVKLTPSDNLKILLDFLHELMICSSFNYNILRVERLISFSDYLTFVHYGMMWFIAIIILCMIVYCIWFLLVIHAREYSVLVLAQGVTGIAGALLALLLARIYRQQGQEFSALSWFQFLSTMGIGAVLGITTGLIVTTPHMLLKKYIQRK